MYKRFKKIAAIILTICMVLSMAPAVYAESEGPVMTQVDFLIYDVYGLDATILSSGAGSVDHLSYVVGDNEPVNVYDGAINKQFDEALSVKVTVFVEFGADVTDGSAHNVSLQYRVLSDNGEWSEQQFDSKTVYCPAHGVPEQPEPEPTGQPDDPEPAESPAPTDPPGDDGGDNGSIVNPGEGGNEGGETEQPGNPSIVIGEPSDEDPFNPPPSGEEGGGGAPAPGFWVYSPPNSDEIDLFYVSPNVRDLVNIDATLVDIARKELAAEDSREERYKTDVVKYNNWFYDVDDAESVSDYDGELTEHNWNAVFVTWCAEQLCYVDFNRFPMTNDATEMFEWLCNVDENNVLTLGEALSTMTEYDIQEGDIVFIPEEDGYNVGIVSAFDKETRTASFIFGDHNKAVEEEEFDLFSLPSTTTFVHIYVPDAQLAAIASFLIRELDIKPSAAAGILANIRWESGFNPTALGDGGTSYGLCQWHMGRWDNLVEYCNGQDVSWTTVEGQLMFLVYELKSQYPSLIERMQNCKDDDEGAYDIAFDFSMTFERPAGMEASASMRGYSASRTMFPTIVRTVEEELSDDAEVEEDESAEPGPEITQNASVELTEDDTAEEPKPAEEPEQDETSEGAFPWRRSKG